MRRVLYSLLGFCAVTACTTTTNLAGIPEQKPASKAQPESRARVHTELAALYYQQNSFKTALDELAMAVRVDPNYAPAFNMYGLVYMGLGENDRAADSFQRAVVLAPADPDIRNNYGFFLCRAGQPEAGLKQLAQAWTNPLYTTPGVALANASRCAAGMGDSRLAAQYRQQAERLGAAVDATPVTPSSTLQ